MTTIMRQSPINIEPRPNLSVGDRVRFADTVQRWTVRGVTRGGRFVVLTKPFNLKRTVLYTVVDFERGVRGVDNYYGLGYETDAEVANAIHEFEHTEDGSTICERDIHGEFCRGGAEVSSRSGNHVRLDFRSVNDRLVDWAGRPVGDV